MGTADFVTIGFIVILVLALAFLLLHQEMQKRKHNKTLEQIAKRGQKSSIKRNNLFWLYRFFKSAPFFKKYFIKIKRKIEIIYPTDITEINKKTTSVLATGVLVAIGGAVFAIVASKGDIFFICAGLLVTYVLLTSTVNSSITKMEMKLLHQFSGMLSKVRHCYNNTLIIGPALLQALDELPYEISLHVQTVYDIISSPKMKQKIDEYIGTEPNQYMLMFLSICSSIKEYGDKKLEDGTGLFVTDLDYLKEEINEEIIDKRKNAAAFKALPTMCIAAVIAIKPIESWARANMTEIAQYYTALYGIVAMMVIFAAAFICYTLVISLRDGEKEIEKESDIFARAAQMPFLSTRINSIIKKNYTKYMRYDDLLKGLGNHTGPKAFCLKRIVAGVSVGLIVVTLLLTANITQKAQAINDWTDAFADSIVPNEEYRESMREIGSDYVKVYKGNKDVTVQDVKEDIRLHTNLKKDVYIEEVANMVMQRLDTYRNTHFRLYYLIIGIACGTVAFNVPVWLLKFKKNIVDTRKEEEVIQFQSLILILMHINGTTLPVILEWMERFSYCFKETIVECRLSLCYGRQQALQDMKNRELFEPFRDFTDNLLAIDRVSVAKAFSEIQTERNYYKKKREQDREENRTKRAMHARRLAFIPAAAAIIFYLIMPMMMYALNMLQEIKTIMG